MTEIPGRVWRIAPLVLALLAACGPKAVPTVTATPAPAAAPRKWPDDLRWVRASAEYRALALQVYRQATARVIPRGEVLARGSWAVILDADETVLDNSEHERRRDEAGIPFSAVTWVPWVRERAAPPVPGAVEFIRAVQGAGGKVAIVTNRADSLCADTRANLEAVGVRAEFVLCKPPTTDGGNKNLRFDAIARGTAPGSTGPLHVLAWVGDNIQDFPRLTQSARTDSAALAPFGDRYFMLANPMYGSWEE